MKGNPNHRSEKSDDMKAILNGGALDGHVMAIGEDITGIRVTSPWGVGIYRLSGSKPIAGGITRYFEYHRTEGTPRRGAISTSLKPIAELAWREGATTDAAVYNAGRLELVAEGVDCI